MDLTIDGSYTVSTPPAEGQSAQSCPPIEGEIHVRNPSQSPEIAAEIDRYDECGNKAKGKFTLALEVTPDQYKLTSESRGTLEGSEMRLGFSVCTTCP